jgi:hypothetical protein
MKLQYTEFRPSVNRSEVEVLAEIKEPEDFRDAILAEIKVCMDNDAQAVAHKLVDWHYELVNKDGVKPGAKLVHNYGTGRDPVGTWEIIS